VGSTIDNTTQTVGSTIGDNTVSGTGQTVGNSVSGLTGALGGGL
jgi:hypothetical protein